MMKEFLTFEDCNVIRVDWGAGSKIPYTQVRPTGERVESEEVTIREQNK